MRGEGKEDRWERKRMGERMGERKRRRRKERKRRIGRILLLDDWEEGKEEEDGRV